MPHQMVSLRTVPVMVQNPLTSETSTVYALLDDGSNRSVISEKLAQVLQLQVGTSRAASLVPARTMVGS